VLGLLAASPWSSYELTRQMDRSLGRIWPRAASKLYEEPKKLVAHGLARASSQQAGRRTRTVYAITAKGRRAMAAWLQTPGEGPVLEFEQLMKIFLAENGIKTDALATLAATMRWAQARSAESLAVGQQYLDGKGPFPERLAQLELTGRFLSDLYAIVGDWARWAEGIVETWPEDPRQAHPDLSAIEETVRRAAASSEAVRKRHHQRSNPPAAAAQPRPGSTRLSDGQC
jgi:PadR family transcriptional regulator, regulatory protein AphA